MSEPFIEIDGGTELGRSSRLENIALTDDGVNRDIAMAPQLLAKPANVDINRSGLGFVGISPNRLQQIGPRKAPARIALEQVQEFLFFLREMDLGSCRAVSSSHIQ